MAAALVWWMWPSMGRVGAARCRCRWSRACSHDGRCECQGARGQGDLGGPLAAHGDLVRSGAGGRLLVNRGPDGSAGSLDLQAPPWRTRPLRSAARPHGQASLADLTSGRGAVHPPQAHICDRTCRSPPACERCGHARPPPEPSHLGRSGTAADVRPGRRPQSGRSAPRRPGVVRARPSGASHLHPPRCETAEGRGRCRWPPPSASHPQDTESADYLRQK
jgi:hypothetical protein